MSEQTARGFMMDEKKSQRNLTLVARGTRIGRLVVLLALVPIGIAILILGLDGLRAAYLAQRLSVSTWSVGLTSFGGVLIIFALVLILLLYLVEQHLTARIQEQEFSARGRDSIKRLHEWLPGDSEKS